MLCLLFEHTCIGEESWITTTSYEETIGDRCQCCCLTLRRRSNYARVGFGCLLIKKKGVCVKCNKSTISLSVLLHNLLYIYCVFGIEMEKKTPKNKGLPLIFLIFRHSQI